MVRTVASDRMTLMRFAMGTLPEARTIGAYAGARSFRNGAYF